MIMCKNENSLVDKYSKHTVLMLFTSTKFNLCLSDDSMPAYVIFTIYIRKS